MNSHNPRNNIYLQYQHLLSFEKELKKELRKSKTILDAFALAIQIAKGEPEVEEVVPEPVVETETTNLETLDTHTADYTEQPNPTVDSA